MFLKQLTLGMAFIGIVAAQAPDNTKTNQRDRNGGVTADDQKMNKADRELAGRVRKAVYADKSLSTYAHNIKIIARDGNVTLKGPVRTQAEKDAIAEKANGIAGATKVTNELEIAPDNK